MRGSPLSIDVVIPERAQRFWQQKVIQRLDAEGYDVAVCYDRASIEAFSLADTCLAFERRVFGRREPSLRAIVQPLPERTRHRVPMLRLVLTDGSSDSAVPTITLRCAGAALGVNTANAIAAGALPFIEAILDGQTIVDRAFPMLDRREATSLGLEDMLARAVTLLLSVVRAFAEDRLSPLAETSNIERSNAGFLLPYVTRALPRLGREAARRTRFHHAHWRVGYRFNDGQGVVESGRLGTGWTAIPDTPGRFYADPFAFYWQGRPQIFVEDYVQADRKAVISVAEFREDGSLQAPRVVLEEPHHLSYPQVFARDGEIWMLPEASASGKLTLYRALSFPDGWQPEAVLIEGEISDATLLEHNGSLWLFATDRDGFGSTSDTLVVFQAPRLLGPWRPHHLNPILIDRRRARPGGGFQRDAAGRLLLPVQDGTHGYGGGLGVAHLLELDSNTVRFAEPSAVRTNGDWPHRRVHTLNRSGSLEVIDGIAAMVRRWRT